MKFHTFYIQLVASLCEQYDSLFSGIQDAAAHQQTAPSVPSPSNSRVTTSSQTRHSQEGDEAILDASSVPCRPNLRRSPSSNGGLRELPLAPHEAHPFGPTKLSRDLLSSLIAFCRSKCYEQQVRSRLTVNVFFFFPPLFSVALYISLYLETNHRFWLSRLRAWLGKTHFGHVTRQGTNHNMNQNAAEMQLNSASARGEAARP